MPDIYTFKTMFFGQLFDIKYGHKGINTIVRGIPEQLMGLLATVCTVLLEANVT